MNDSHASGTIPRACPFNPASLAFQVLGAASAVEAHLEGTLAQVGLSLAKLRVLSRLVEAGEPLPLGGLADHCSCVRSNMTQLVDRLEADKLVERVNDPTDRRSVRASLTAAGRERQTQGVEILASAERDVFSRLSEADRADLSRLVQQLTRTS
jgi:DNA-binding MarR family transcriptional regulator